MSKKSTSTFLNKMKEANKTVSKHVKAVNESIKQKAISAADQLHKEASKTVSKNVKAINF